MKEESAKDCGDLRAELAALQQRLQILEANQVVSTDRALLRRPVLSRKVLLGTLPVAVLLAAGGLLYAAGDALFIDPNGNVGIGTAQPSAVLQIGESANVNFSNSTGLGIVQADNETVGLSIRRTGKNPVFQFCSDKNCNYVEHDKGTGQIHLGSDGNGHSAVLSVGMPGGNVGIGTVSPVARLDVAGTVRLGGGVAESWFPNPDGNASISGNQTIIGSKGGKEFMRVDANGNVGIGTVSPAAKLDVNGDARIRGKVHSQGRYQRDNDSEATYEVSPRYHLSLTAQNFGGSTKTIPQGVLEELCADQDGCEVRLAMTRWNSDQETESASRSGVLYYSTSRSSKGNRWRASFGESDVDGTDGDGNTKHVRDIWSTCFFTDGTYFKYSDQRDTQIGMQLLVWNGYKNQNRTCELTLID